LITRYALTGNGKLRLPSNADKDHSTDSAATIVEYEGPFRFTWEKATSASSSSSSSGGGGTLHLLDSVSGAIRNDLGPFIGSFDSFHVRGTASLEIPDVLDCETQLLDGEIGGRCTIRYRNGFRFAGEWRNFEWTHGRLQMGKNGGTYEGSFEAGLFHGAVGTYEAADRSHYRGSFERGLFHGAGELTLASGSVYVGEFRDGKRHGHGRLSDPVQQLSYEGAFEDDRFGGGSGRMETAEFVYEGEMRLGKFSGRGKLTERRTGGGSTTYEGQWHDGKRHGQGRATFADGSIYEGTFEDDLPQGHGRLFWKERNMSMEGTWQTPTASSVASKPNDTPFGTASRKRRDRGAAASALASMVGHGQPRPVGTMRLVAPDFTYEGETDNGGHLNGRGVMTLSSGLRYEGEFKDDKFHGRGKLISADGAVLESEFRNGKPVGTDGSKLGRVTLPKNMRLGWRDLVSIVGVLLFMAAFGYVVKNFYDKYRYYSMLEQQKQQQEQQQQQTTSDTTKEAAAAGEYVATLVSSTSTKTSTTKKASITTTTTTLPTKQNLDSSASVVDAQSTSTSTDSWIDNVFKFISNLITTK
jgi:hypothetical protein